MLAGVTHAKRGVSGAESGAVSDVRPPAPEGTLARVIRDIYSRASDHRVSCGVEGRWLRALRARRGERDEISKAALRDAGMDESLMSQITDVKCNAAKSQLDEIYVNGPNDEFTMDATPLPDIPEEDAVNIFAETMKAVMVSVMATGAEPTRGQVMAAAERRYNDRLEAERVFSKERVARMEVKMRDQLEEGGFREAKAGYVNDVVTYGTGLIEGPVDVVERVMEAKKTKVGASVYGFGAKKVLKFRSVSPWDVYPAPESQKIGDSPVVVAVRFTGPELAAFADGVLSKGADAGGWEIGTVKDILADNPRGWRETRGGLNADRRRLEGNGGDGVFCGDGWMYDGLKLYAFMRGRDLAGNGAADLARKKVKPDEYYMVEAVTVADKVIFCRVTQNVRRFPLAKGVFYDVPGSFWGKSIADRCVVAQSIQDSCVYWLKINMGMSSLPMFYARDFRSLLDKGPGALDVKAGKFWALNGSGLGVAGGPPIGTIDIASHIPEITAALDRSKIMADDDTGIPAYSYGGASSASGVARTATGLKMLTEAAERGLKMVIGQTDIMVIESLLRGLYEYNLTNDPDPLIKGDAQIIVRGVMGRVLREQEKEEQLRFLGMVAGNMNLFQLVGPRAVAVILRKVSEGMGIPGFMPSDAQLEDAELLNKIRQIAEIESGAAKSAGQAQEPAARQPGGFGNGGGHGPQVMPDATGATAQAQAQPQGMVAERAGAA